MKKYVLSLLTAMCLMIWALPAQATHFRYGTINWRVPDPVGAPLTVEFTVQQAWRTAFLACDNLDFGDGGPFGNGCNEGSPTIGNGVDATGPRLHGAALQWSRTRTREEPSTPAFFDELLPHLHADRPGSRRRQLPRRGGGRSDDRQHRQPGVRARRRSSSSRRAASARCSGSRRSIRTASRCTAASRPGRVPSPRRSPAAHPRAARGPRSPTPATGCTLTWNTAAAVDGPEVRRERRDRVVQRADAQRRDDRLHHRDDSGAASDLRGRRRLRRRPRRAVQHHRDRHQRGRRQPHDDATSARSGASAPSPARRSRARSPRRTSNAPSRRQGVQIMSIVYTNALNLTGSARSRSRCRVPELRRSRARRRRRLPADGFKYCVRGDRAVQRGPRPAHRREVRRIDNDCNGTTDEGNPEANQACTLGLPGLCAPGTTTLQRGERRSASRTVTPAAQAETCDGVDQDCDGVVDNGFNVGAGLHLGRRPVPRGAA
jgi:hypothetical protein